MGNRHETLEQKSFDSHFTKSIFSLFFLFPLKTSAALLSAEENRPMFLFILTVILPTACQLVHQQPAQYQAMKTETRKMKTKSSGKMCQTAFECFLR
jgi:hypothetical protein